MKIQIGIIILLYSVLSFSNPVNDEALQKTQELLRNQSQRNEVLKTDTKAREADDFATKAVGGNAQDKNEVYNISADIMGKLSKDNNGDAQKMQEQLLKALQSPDQFLKSLPPEIQNNIKGVAERVEQRREVSNVKSKAKP